jgi:hypothetical protein
VYTINKVSLSRKTGTTKLFIDQLMKTMWPEALYGSVFVNSMFAVTSYHITTPNTKNQLLTLKYMGNAYDKQKIYL